LFNTEKKVSVVELALNTVNSTLQIISSKDNQITRENKWLNKHIIALNEKFVLGFACIILFFVGAPLGALIKKGGLGLPMVIAILLFLTYHFIGLFAKNSATNGKLDPILGTWLSTIIMLPLSIYLTRTATFDKPLISLNFISQPIKKLFKIKSYDELESDELLDVNTPEFSILQNHDNDKLIDIIKNYHQYDYSASFKNSAIKILGERGITEEELRLGGNLTNPIYEDANREMNLYNENANVSKNIYILYSTYNYGACIK